jgi:hypothetical protein
MRDNVAQFRLIRLCSLLLFSVFVRGGRRRVRSPGVGSVERRPLRRLSAHHVIQVRHSGLTPRSRRLFPVCDQGLEIPLRLVRIHLRLQRNVPPQRRFRMPSAAY